MLREAQSEKGSGLVRQATIGVATIVAEWQPESGAARTAARVPRVRHSVVPSAESLPSFNDQRDSILGQI